MSAWFHKDDGAMMARAERLEIIDGLISFNANLLTSPWAGKDASGDNGTGLTVGQSIARLYKHVEIPDAPAAVRFAPSGQDVHMSRFESARACTKIVRQAADTYSMFCARYSRTGN